MDLHPIEIEAVAAVTPPRIVEPPRSSRAIRIVEATVFAAVASYFVLAVLSSFA